MKYLTKEQVKANGAINSYPYSVLSEAFLYILNDDLRSARLFHSDVIFARYAIHKNTGYWLPLPEVEKLMKEFGWQQRSRRRF